MTPKDWTLLVIAAAKDKLLQPVQLQKALFLLSKLHPNQLQTGAFYRFEPRDYGPFCRDVYDDAEALKLEGMVHIDQPQNLSYHLFSVTNQGAEKARALRDPLSQDVLNYLDGVVAWASSLSFRQLVTYIYLHFPEMKVNSVFQE